jgi:hypothetical protein
MRIFGFRSSFRPSLIRLYKRHSMGEWVLPMTEVRKFSLGRPPEKTCKTREQACVGYVSNLRSQGPDSPRPNGWKMRGRGRNRDTEGENGRRLAH